MDFHSMNYSEAAQWVAIAFLLVGFATQGRRSGVIADSVRELARITEQFVDYHYQEKP